MTSIIYETEGRQSLNVRCVFLDDSSLERAGKYRNNQAAARTLSVMTLLALPSDQSLRPGDRRPVGTLLSRYLWPHEDRHSCRPSQITGRSRPA